MAIRNIEAILKWVGQGDAPAGYGAAIEEWASLKAALVEVEQEGGLSALRAAGYDRRSKSITRLEECAKEES